MVNVEQLRSKYNAERDKRLKSRPPSEFSIAAGDFIKDQYADESFTRDPISDDCDVIIVGAGLSGIVHAVKLAKAGITNVRVIDMATDFGGTWYWNRYPGVRCDVESYIYIPMLEEIDSVPSEKYSTGAEIADHLRRLASKHNLYDKAVFQTKVTGANWDDTANRWKVATDRGDDLSAKFLITVIGTHSTARLPGIPGIKDFKGHLFHTARWDYDYTGGDYNGNLTGLADKKVALIGTGSTGIQVVPPLAEDSEHLYVIQRTPIAITFRGNRPTDPEWAKSLEPGWQAKRSQNFVDSIACIAEEDMCDDGWTYLARKAGPIVQTAPPEGFVITQEMIDGAERMDMEAMQENRDNIASIVKDEATAKALMPYYRTACKRPGFSDHYLQTFNRDNVTLVDTDGMGVTRITENSIVCGDKEVEVDCIILASGFDVNARYDIRAGFDVVGVNGTKLSEKWDGGFRTLYGLQVSGLPNYFPVGYHGNAVSPNYTHTVEGLSDHVVHIMKHCVDNNIVKVDVEQDAEDAWVKRMDDKDVGTEFLAQCTPGYFNNEGKKGPTIFSGAYGGGPYEYYEMVEAWRENGKFEGLVFTKGS